MPDVGDIKGGKELGYKSIKHTWMWAACVGCGKERWVLMQNGKPQSMQCRRCGSRAGAWGKSGERNSNWKGGRCIDKGGYVLILLQPEDFFYPMTNRDGYVYEHRLIVAKALGRNLHSWELVHHKHTKYPAGSIENKQDNRYPENLQLVMIDQHNQMTIMERKIDLQAQRIVQLEAEIVLLRKQLNGRGLWLEDHMITRG